MLTLNSPIGDLGRLAKIMSRRLSRLGLETCDDLLFYFPFRYEDLSELKPIAKLELGGVASIRGRLELIKNFRSPVKRKLVTEALISDSTGQIKAVWFNQPYLTKVLKPGQELYLAGKVENPYYTIQLTNPSYEFVRNDAPTHTARIVPVYSVTSDVSQKQLRTLTREVMPLTYQIKEWLPDSILKKYDFPEIGDCLRAIHFPESLEQANRARDRLKFDEIFLIQLQIQKLRAIRKLSRAPVISFKEEETKAFVKSLPFSLTDDQRKVSWEILKDLSSGQPMNRLVQGEVGSGKTITAAIAIHNAALNGYQSVLMAPTEILARQHFLTLQKFLPTLKVALLTSSNHEIDGQEDLFVGTHALIEDKVSFKRLGLAIIDEQHRFGVEQRKALTSKSGQAGLTPHLLSMTATPIPRTLALTWYSDLDLSEIKQLPKGRKKIMTSVVLENDRPRAYDFVRQEIKKGRQVYVICPLIDQSDKLGVKSVTAQKLILESIFPEFKIALLHGRLKPSIKEEVMANFKAAEYQMLVATTVIEVGVDVPNATIMMIEGAERFGLSQLHQIRGRVGRGEHQSHCYVFPSETAPHTLARLNALVNCQDGFELAQKDLEIRGAGELYGTRQSGLPEFKLADFNDYATIKKAQEEAKNILGSDSELNTLPILRDKVAALVKRIHLE